MTPIWEHWPQKLWSAREWELWKRAGRPTVRAELRIGADDPPPLDRPPVIAPTRTVPSFTLFPAKRTARDTRGRAVDALLDRHLGGRRRR